MKTRTKTRTRTTSSSPPAQVGELESVASILARMFEVCGDRLERRAARARSDRGRADGRQGSVTHGQVKGTGQARVDSESGR